MIALSSGTRVHLALEAVDLRGSFNALSALVKNVLALDPLSGQVFVFANRRRHQTTFNIPIRSRSDRLQMASAAWKKIMGGPSKGKEGERSHRRRG
jgi:hypothetical protein